MGNKIHPHTFARDLPRRNPSIRVSSNNLNIRETYQSRDHLGYMRLLRAPSDTASFVHLDYLQHVSTPPWRAHQENGRVATRALGALRCYPTLSECYARLSSQYSCESRTPFPDRSARRLDSAPRNRTVAGASNFCFMPAKEVSSSSMSEYNAMSDSRAPSSDVRMED